MSGRRGMRRRDEGFTLLEILVAFTVAALLLGAGMRAFSTDIAGVAQARARVEAVLLADSSLAEVGASIPLAEGDRVDRLDDGSTRRIVITRLPDPSPSSETPLVAPYGVALTVAWREAGREHSLTLRTVRLKRLR